MTTANTHVVFLTQVIHDLRSVITVAEGEICEAFVKHYQNIPEQKKWFGMKTIPAKILSHEETIAMMKETSEFGFPLFPKFSRFRSDIKFLREFCDRMDKEIRVAEIFLDGKIDLALLTQQDRNMLAGVVERFEWTTEEKVQFTIGVVTDQRVLEVYVQD